MNICYMLVPFFEVFLFFYDVTQVPEGHTADWLNWGMLNGVRMNKNTF